MALKRVTMQDIADACGLSRNTISKIFNDRGNVPEATRKLALQKAQELGYYRAPESDTVQRAAHSPNIALITSRMPSDYHFGILFLPVFAERLSRAGYTLMFYELSAENLHEKKLPAHMSLEQTAGILGIELFDRDYLNMLCSLGLPTLSVDAYAEATSAPMNCDFIIMENLSSTMALTSQVIDAGADRLGFVGDISHCCSFHERWVGFCSALNKAGIPVEQELCILAGDAEPYNDPNWLMDRLRGMPYIPDAFICANDYLAFRIMAAVNGLGLSVPADVMVTGFDDSPQSSVTDPSLTTVQIPNAEFGSIAADILLNRIEHPARPFSNTYVKTTPIWRNSTRRRPQTTPSTP